MRGRDLTFLDPAVVARLGTLELRARTIVEGFLSGLHRSPSKGFSVEFAEYRPYLPGDDLSTIDWKVYARSDRFFVKKSEEETNLECRLLVDVSASMAYASHAVSKLEYACCLAASLAYLMRRQRDAVGLTAFDSRIVSMLPVSARPGHLRALLASLEQLRPGAGTDMSKPFHQLADTLAKRGLVIVISDLLDEPSRVVEGLKHLRFRGTDVIVFQTLDPAERTFPFDRPARFRDLETAEEVTATPALVRDDYLAALGGMIEFYKRELGVSDIDYALLDTSEPLDLALLAYLDSRRRST
jgi:uncharacterized protein (DUF58 family)